MPTKKKSLGRQELVRNIHRMTGIKTEDIKAVLDANGLCTINAIAQGRAVRVGSYYSIYPKYCPSHHIYSPRYDKYIDTEPHCLLKVSSFSKMKDALDIAKDNMDIEE